VALAKSGAAVAVLGRDQAALSETVDEISAGGGKAISITCDVVQMEQIRCAVATTESELGPVTLLINNAGIGGAGGPLWQTDPEEWWRVQEVNLKGPFLATHAVLEGMVKLGAGRIVNVGSYIGIAPTKGGSAYSTSKAALLRLTDCTAADVAETGISVFAISPGFVWTDMTRELDKYLRANDPNYQPMDEAWVFPSSRAADLCVRLATGEADQLSGRMIHARDDLDDMIARADDIVEQDQYTLRLSMP